VYVTPRTDEATETDEAPAVPSGVIANCVSPVAATLMLLPHVLTDVAPSATVHTTPAPVTVAVSESSAVV